MLVAQLLRSPCRLSALLPARGGHLILLSTLYCEYGMQSRVDPLLLFFLNQVERIDLKIAFFREIKWLNPEINNLLFKISHLKCKKSKTVIRKDYYSSQLLCLITTFTIIFLMLSGYIQGQSNQSLLALTSDALPWFLVYTRPAQESVALQNLQQQGFEAYLPLYKRLKKSDAGMLAVFEPMFARYVFFRPSHAAQSIGPARSTRGVARLVSFGYEPACLSAYVLRAIHQIEQARSDTDATELGSLQAGHVVRFCNPAFQNLQGLVKAVSARRVEVLLELMGRQQLISVSPDQLQAA
jgi:transcriptional antiterminator RfaH